MHLSHLTEDTTHPMSFYEKHTAHRNTSLLASVIVGTRDILSVIQSPLSGPPQQHQHLPAGGGDTRQALKAGQ